MRLKLEIPEGWARTTAASGAVEAYEPAPGVVVRLGPLTPVPLDLRAWGDGIVLRGVDVTQYRVRNVDDVHTSRGWPVSVFFSDIVSILAESPGGGELAAGPRRVLERRLHALYVFDQHCAWASAASAELARFDALMPVVRKVLLTGQPDWTGGRVTSLHDLFRGLATFRPPPASAAGQAGPKEPDQVK